jgi:hypothetical protein
MYSNIEWFITLLVGKIATATRGKLADKRKRVTARLRHDPLSVSTCAAVC